jgi:hypothetical protein
MIYHQQQRLKDKLSVTENKKDDEQSIALNNKLPDLISNTKPILPSSFNPLPSTYQTSLLSLPTFSIVLIIFK